MNDVPTWKPIMCGAAKSMRRRSLPVPQAHFLRPANATSGSGPFRVLSVLHDLEVWPLAVPSFASRADAGGNRALGVSARKPTGCPVPPPIRGRPLRSDFYCASARLAVELDGAVHADDTAVARDQARDAWLAERGIRVLRFENAALGANPDAVLSRIMAALEEPP